MTYGRARLCLGIMGVGSLVTMATIVLLVKLPQSFLQTGPAFGVQEALQLTLITGLFMMWLVPLDFLGGYLLPRKFGKANDSFREWLRSYAVTALLQGLLFVLFGSLIIVVSQFFGVVAGLIAIGVLMVGCFLGRNRLVQSRQIKSEVVSKTLSDALAKTRSWKISVPATIVVNHRDTGFTGGVIGLGKNARIVIPKAWLSFPTEELALAIARRATAIANGSYLKGLVLAFVWNWAGFSLCTLLPGADLASVAGLATTMCGFTLWTFLGLLILPTVSRNASLNIDHALQNQGVALQLIATTASNMDQLQDDEPERPHLIETIFHPVPSVSGRTSTRPVTGYAAWNVARTTLFFSWACLGLLSRSVHCNIGRPELWTMLPSD